MADSISGNLVTRRYNNFRGVDYRDGEISLNRSPDALNLWKNYRDSNLLETRPDIELSETYDNTIFGLFFYRVGNTEMKIVHCGTKLYKEVNGEKTELYSGMNIIKSQTFVYNNILYIKDGINYLSYDGETIGEVTGYIPTTSIGRSPKGGGTIYEDVNMLSDYRKNGFNGDGESTEYHLDTQSIDSVLSILINDVCLGSEEYSVDLTRGIITFNNAPSKPLTDGQDNVFITFKKTVVGYRERINKCTLLSVFDNRVFFSGNQDYPNVLWHCSLNDPTYVSDLDYYNEGLDLAPIKSMVAGNNALWVFKEPSQANTTVFYHNPTIDAEYGKIYPSSHSSISTGCVATGINFNDDICFFSDRGLEGISGDITSEQVIAHRSSLVDSKLLAEANYKNMLLEEWEGYLLVCIDNKVYLADSRQRFNLNNNIEYEWFYWELPKKVTCTCVKDGILYLGTEEGIYTLTNTTNDVESYWTTPLDNFKYGNYQKTTNKRGCIIEVEGDEVSVSVKTNKDEMELIKTFENVSDYIVARIKRKKFKDIQIKIHSTRPVKLESITLESFIGAYIKR